MLQLYLAVMGEVVVKEGFDSGGGEGAGEGVELVGGVADAEQEEGEILVVEHSLLVEVKHLEQELHLLLVADARKHHQSCEHLDRVHLPPPPPVPYSK